MTITVDFGPKPTLCLQLASAVGRYFGLKAVFEPVPIKLVRQMTPDDRFEPKVANALA